MTPEYQKYICPSILEILEIPAHQKTMLLSVDKKGQLYSLDQVAVGWNTIFPIRNPLLKPLAPRCLQAVTTSRNAQLNYEDKQNL